MAQPWTKKKAMTKFALMALAANLFKFSLENLLSFFVGLLFEFFMTFSILILFLSILSQIPCQSQKSTNSSG